MHPLLRKRKFPRAQDPQAEKLVNGSYDELMEDHCIDELMEACTNKDPKQFRSALDALVMNGFDYGDE